MKKPTDALSKFCEHASTPRKKKEKEIHNPAYGTVNFSTVFQN
jgi:hypothetical protein